MKPNKISIALYCSSLSWGGLEMNVVRFAEGFKARGLRVVIFCVEESEIFHRAESRKIETIAIDRNKRYFDFLNARKSAKILKKLSLEVLWVNDPRDLDTCAWIKRFLKQKIKLVYNQGMQFSKPKRDFFHTLRFKAIDAWVAPLPYLKKQVAEMTKVSASRVYEIPRGVDEKRVHTGLSSDQARELLKLPPSTRLLGVIGRIDKLKGQDTAIKALILLKDKLPGTQLLLMGETTRHESEEYKIELEKLITENQIEEIVHIRPYSDNVALFYSAIDTCIVPSHAETIGMITVEAMLAGVPVYGTNTSGTPELLGHGERGWLFSPEDHIKLAELLTWSEKNKDKEQEKTEKAQAFALEHYTLNHVLDEYIKMMKGILAH